MTPRSRLHPRQTPPIFAHSPREPGTGTRDGRSCLRLVRCAANFIRQCCALSALTWTMPTASTFPGHQTPGGCHSRTIAVPGRGDQAGPCLAPPLHPSLCRVTHPAAGHTIRATSGSAPGIDGPGLPFLLPVTSAFRKISITELPGHPWSQEIARERYSRLDVSHSRGINHRLCLSLVWSRASWACAQESFTRGVLASNSRAACEADPSLYASPPWPQECGFSNLRNCILGTPAAALYLWLVYQPAGLLDKQMR